MRGWIPGQEVSVATDLNDALKRLAADPGLKPLAGGTDVMVYLEAGTLPDGRWLSIHGLKPLHGIDISETHITIGALTTFGEIRRHPELRTIAPMLVEAAELTGAWAIQNRGTIGGNIANASPAADTPPVLLSHDAELVLVREGGTRVVPYATFHTGYKTMDLQAGELIQSVRLVRKDPANGWRPYYRKVGTRKAQAISKLALSAIARLDGAGAMRDVRLSFASVAATPIRANAAEAALEGQKPDDAAAITTALDALGDAVTPRDDIRSTAIYRTQVARNLVGAFLAGLKG